MGRGVREILWGRSLKEGGMEYMNGWVKGGKGDDRIIDGRNKLNIQLFVWFDFILRKKSVVVIRTVPKGKIPCVCT